MLFGVALPKIGTFFSKIREKRREIKDFIEENGPEGAGAHCPMGKADFKDKIQALKVNDKRSLSSAVFPKNLLHYILKQLQ